MQRTAGPTPSVAVPPSGIGRGRAQPKGRTPSPAARERVAQACAGLAARRDLLIEHLHRLQDALGGLTRDDMAAVAERLRLSQAEVYEVATFYHHFRVLDDGAVPPRVTVRVCTSLPCALAGGEALLARVRQALRGDDTVAVEAAPCMGQCHQAPAACVGQRQMAPATDEAVVACARSGPSTPRALPASGAPPQPHDYAQLERLLAGELTPAAVLRELQASDLRGLGGAGFPAWRKWATVAGQPGPREGVVNIDEGEVGTFKDWHLLAHDPRPALEGMLIAAAVVGVQRLWIYVRDEYHDVRALLRDELAALQARLAAWQQRYPAAFGDTTAIDPGRAQRPLLPPGGPVIELRRGAGAYICGEESALIESLEGKRGLPRLRPPITAVQGVFGRPTLAHNVETLWWLPTLLRDGGAAWATAGVRGRHGWRRYSVSGRVQRPGCYLLPAGSTLRELIDAAGGMADGHRLYAFLPGGASGGILPASLADVPLDFDTLAEHGAFVGSMAVVVLSEADRARDAALSLLRFFEHESCGQCTPCRAGTRQAVALMQQPVWDGARLDDLAQAMRDASICGLGQAAPNPFGSVLRYFPHEVSP
ncbi:MAG: NAD(P)H-dependent oxidoreductase subunit E [Tepidimonas ignava]|uniref:NAD-dependent formate dehydrogenase flavoprotein subunit n=1 Tax=Tepidimonas ignava TaxID=114249 RepID=A0A4R3LEH8_9BURK|nr:NAD(P)H-dependent oxidoreductase subunit E [Tepidimonas ignava]MCX7815164.1 NAD(P)H-dependent oxidoreductase subunit E [Tepidimonas ignava]TCS97798.1 NAD-dependent formate dehydrogenase flavoprotein subunit [Tepidimonas ignava]TSE23660.1 NADH-quinone oxidoreductase subunit F [Tepidimonas ignava]